jgi:hypothetical protein
MFVRKRSFVLGAAVVLVLVASTSFASARLGSTFADVPPSHPFFDEIQWMNQNDIAGGYNDGSYRPGAPVSRAAMAAFMSRLSDSFYTTQATVDPGSADTFSATANCNEGDRALSGGGRTSQGGLFITDSDPSDEDTWRVRWETPDSGDVNPSSITVFVFCAPPLSEVAG